MAHLQGLNSQVDILPHAHLHVKLRQTLVCLGARCPHLLTRSNMLREVQHVALHWKVGVGERGGGWGSEVNQTPSKCCDCLNHSTPPTN